MPLHTFTELELRGFCKEYLESLELWLRRIIDDILTIEYGQDYFNHIGSDGQKLISNKIKNKIQSRISDEPERYPRPIDACLLESEIKIISNPNLYEKHFKKVFQEGFPEGRAELLTFLNRLVQPRNKLYHANPLSVREAERVVCYTNDIIDSIKNFYLKNNMNQEFNVPLIIRYSDSFGNTLHRNRFHTKTIAGFEYLSFEDVRKCFLRPGEKVSIEIEIDPTFPKNEYQIIWDPHIEGTINNNHYSYTVQNKDVSENFRISATVKTDKEWHRLNGVDDVLVIGFKVLPPL